jgi:putative DNA methylase
MKNRKLIEVALPLEAINNACAYEKMPGIGPHPRGIHLWWARRPLAAARAVIWSSLVDDPSSHPEQFPTEEAQTKERQRLFAVLEELVKWKNSNNQDILTEAKAEIMKSTGGNPPALLDPFAGGGAIPLEAQRLGLEAHASDLNPVAVMINKAMIEIPPKFAGQPPVNPDSRAKIGFSETEWMGAQGLAEDVRYYGEWMKKKAFERIGHLYPKVKDEHGQEHAVIAWIWARTVKCPNPACGCEMPLASSFVLSKKKGKEAYVQPVIEGKNIRYEVKHGNDAPEAPKTARGANFKCIACGNNTQGNYVRTEATEYRMGAKLMAIVAEGKNGKLYLSPTNEDEAIASKAKPLWKPNQKVTTPCHDVDRLPMYGMPTWGDAFTNRQLTALTTFSDLIAEAREQIRADGGADDCTDAVEVYLAFVVDKALNLWSSLVSWMNDRGAFRETFARQAIPMVWDYA